MRRKHLIFAVALSLLLGSFVAMVAVSQNKSVEALRADMTNAHDRLYNKRSGAWTSYEWSYNRLQTMITEIRIEIRALGGIRLTPSLHPATQGADAVSKIGTAVHLSDQIRERLTTIEKQREITERLWVGDEVWYGVERAWMDYENAVNAFNEEVSPNERVYPTAPEKLIATELYFCQGPCDELFETASLAQVSHQVYCSEKHGTSGTTGVTYYICSDSGTCHRSDEHWRVCGGICGKEFAPKRMNLGQGNYSYYASSPHYVKCDKDVYSQVPGTTCGTEYYTCEHSTCPDKNTHWKSEPVQPCGHRYDSNSSEAYNHRWVKYSCGLHRGYKCKEGDHGIWIASCSETDNHGQTCTNTSGYWKCSPHQHTSPPPSPPHPACGGCGVSYDPDSTSDVNLHRPRTCRFCGKTWRRCQSSTPICDKPYRKRNGLRCWAQ